MLIKDLKNGLEVKDIFLEVIIQSKNFCSAVTEVYKDVEVKRGSLWLDNGVTKERTQRNIFALKKADKE